MLVGVLVHDRPQLLQKCLESLRDDPGAEFTLALYGDAADGECRRTASETPNAMWIDSIEHRGIAYGLNQILHFRRAGEDFIRIDSDSVVSPGWLKVLSSAPEDIVFPRFACGVTYYKGYVVDVLGGFRGPGGTYGGVDIDYLMRAGAAGYTTGLCPEVKVDTPPERNIRGSRREMMETAVKELRKREPIYAQRKDLYEPLSNTPTSEQVYPVL